MNGQTNKTSLTSSKRTKSGSPASQNDELAITPQQKTFLKKLQEITKGGRRDIGGVFSDFLSLSTYCFDSASQKLTAHMKRHEMREQQYKNIANRKGYDAKDIEGFAELLAILTNALEVRPFQDFLGTLFCGELNLAIARSGQFFTPYHVSKLCAELTLDENHVKETIAKKGYIEAYEPSCGAGGMIIAMAQTLARRGIDYQRNLHVTAADIDLRAAQMCFIQLSLLGIPAIVFHQNTITLETFDYFLTPFHAYGFWDFRLARNIAKEPKIEPPAEKEEPAPIFERPNIEQQRDDLIQQRMKEARQMDLF